DRARGRGRPDAGVQPDRPGARSHPADALQAAARAPQRLLLMLPTEYLFAGVLVGNLDAAIEWYTNLFGRPPHFRPNDHEAVWQTAPPGSIYVKRDAARAGNSVVTIAVADLETVIALLTSRGINAGEVEPVGDAGIESKLSDPEGNEITLVQI